MLEVKTFRKATVPPTLIETPSPANLQPTRLALHVTVDDSSCNVYIASGRHVYSVQIPLGASSISKGKESLLIPECTEALHSCTVNSCSHISEIQSLGLAEAEGTSHFMLGSVDSFGHFMVSKLNGSGKDLGLAYSVLPQNCGVGEGSWAGLCFCPTQWSLASVAQSFCKCIDVYDQDKHVRSLHTLLYPSSLTFLQNLSHGGENSILAVTEGCQLTIWDLRMKENGGCLQRICSSLGDSLYAVCSSSAGNIAVGGADRTVTVYDPRRWSSLSRWGHCSKYEVTGLAFSAVDSDYVYVQGVDNEVICGQWKETNKVFSFRGDSNWLGFDKCSGRDVLGGWCDSGSIFVADIVSR